MIISCHDMEKMIIFPFLVYTIENDPESKTVQEHPKKRLLLCTPRTL